ncbi:unannotated protein [freshwater metagenome]|uniref:Unannotated protein n=1 Tax=freshwater metagenome TaxID=449393 RepID=A0A6J7E9S2_9ZZZZ
MAELTLPAEILERTVPDVLDAQADRVPDRVALIADSLLHGTEQRITFAQLRSDAARFSSALAAAGVGEGDRIGILLDNGSGIEAHIAYHAGHRLGAVNAALNTRYVERELSYVLEFMDPRAIIFAPEFGPVLQRLAATIPNATLFEVSDTPELGISFREALEGGDPNHPRTPVAEDADAVWVFTSGTTGNPKAVADTHSAAVACGHGGIHLYGLSDDAVYQSFAPFFTSTGCNTNLLSCLVAGCTLAIEPDFDVHETLERMRRWGTTSHFLVNTVLQLIFQRLTPEEIAAQRFPRLRRVCYGAQAASPEFCRRVWEEIGQGWGVELVNVYGFTESGNCGMFLRPEDHPIALERMGAHGISVGRNSFSSWTDYAVLDPDGNPVALGEIGEICLRGPSIMRGYVREPESTGDVLKHGWCYSGDLATIDEDGFVTYIDRGKAIIRRGGLNISSAEIEGVVMQHPGIAEAAAVPMPNPVLGEDVRVVAVAASDPPPTAEEIIAWCSERLADYKVPRQVDFIDALPRNAMNRVIKSVLTGEGSALS